MQEDLRALHSYNITFEKSIIIKSVKFYSEVFCGEINGL